MVQHQVLSRSFRGSSRISSGATLISDLCWSSYNSNIITGLQAEHDLLLYKVISRLEDYVATQDDIDAIADWSDDNHLVLSPVKYKHMLISRKGTYLAPLPNYYWTAIHWTKSTLLSTWESYFIAVMHHGHLILLQYALKHIRWLDIFTENSIQWQMQIPLHISTPPWFGCTSSMLAQYGRHTPVKTLNFLRAYKGSPVRWLHTVGAHVMRNSWH